MYIPWRSDEESGGHRSIRLVAWTAFVVAIIGLALPDMGAASGYGGHRRPSGGGGIGIGIGIQLLPRGAPAQDVDFDKVERELKREEPASAADEGSSRTTRTTKTAVLAPTRKLIKPRVPYLLELAMDIDKTLMELALTEPANALKLYKNAAAKARAKRDAQGEREALQNVGHVYFITGQFQKAVENYTKALEILRTLRNTEQEAIAVRNIAAVFIASADYQDAEKYGDDALQVFVGAGNNRAAYMTLNNMGVLEKKRGRFQKAEKNYEEALKRYDKTDPIRLVALNNLGTLYRTRGQFKESLEVLQKYLSEAKVLGDPKAQADALDQIAQTFAARANYQKAVENWQQAIEVLAGVGAATDWVKKKVGDAYLGVGKADEAEPYLKDADFDSGLGWLKLVKADPEAAKKHYQQLLSDSQKDENLDELFAAYTGLGKAYEAVGKYQEAEKQYSKGMEVTEEIRSTLMLSERRNFFSHKVSGFARSEPAKGLVRVMFKQKKLAQTIQPSEATRAREFADFLFQKAESSYLDVPQEILENEMAVNDRLASLKVALGVLPKAVDPERFTAVTKEIKSAESQKKNFIQDLSKKYKDYASVKYPRPVALENCAIGPGEYVLLFDVLGEGVGVRLIKGKKVLWGTLAQWPINQFEEEIRSFRAPFEQANLAGFSPDRASSLYNRVLGDAIRQVPDGTPITIIPDGLLALLPFEALVTGGKAQWNKAQLGDYPEGLTYLGDRHPLIYYQSITALTLARTGRQSPKSPGRLLVMADPVFEMADARLQEARPEIKVVQRDHERQISLMAAMEEDSGGSFALKRLEGTERLAKNLEQLYGSSCEVYTGMNATKGRFLEKIGSELNRYGSIVFATHGFAGNNIPGIMEPVLALTMVPPGTDGFLTMNEVAGLKLDADIVALTACQTGVGIHLAGEGVLSIGRAFQCAGARAVAMSLWSVSEDSSVALMDEFFKRLKAGKPRLEAWTEARAQVRKAGFEHPFFWASFVLVGEAR